MSKQVRLCVMPTKPNIEVVYDIALKVHFPYSDERVTLQVCPHTDEFVENADTSEAQIRNVMVTMPTEQTSTLKFDFDTSRKHTVHAEGNNYTIELMAIDKEKFDNQDFLCFEFNVTKDN